MKAILMSIKPQHVANILSGLKTIEIRRRFPEDYVGWVYIYCTKVPLSKQDWLLDKDNKGNLQNPYGKVVARFWCDKVEEIFGWRSKHIKDKYWYHLDTNPPYKGAIRFLTKLSCLRQEEIDQYLQGKNGKAIHITKLEIFDKPKEISEFWNNGKKVKGHNGTYQYSCLTRAPENYCYIKIE